jgi:hypothetical protein
MLGFSGRERRRDMQDVLAPVDGLRPTVIAGEVGDGEGEFVTDLRAGGGEDARTFDSRCGDRMVVRTR